MTCSLRFVANDADRNGQRMVRNHTAGRIVQYWWLDVDNCPHPRLLRNHVRDAISQQQHESHIASYTGDEIECSLISP